LAPIRFLREVIEEKRSRSQLRDFILLLLRILAVGLLAMALARPWQSNSQAIEAILDDATARGLQQTRTLNRQAVRMTRLLVVIAAI